MNTNTIDYKQKIMDYLLAIEGESALAYAIRGAVKTNYNFENLIDMIKSQYKDNPTEMTRVIGKIPMQLILKYKDND